MVNKYQIYVNGGFTNSRSKETYNVINPATEEVIAKVPLCNKDDVRYAIDSAKKAFEEWQYSKRLESCGVLKNESCGIIK